MKPKTKFKQTEIGTIPEEWEVKQVKEIGRVICGKTPPTSNKDYFGEKYPFIRIPDMGKSVFVKDSDLSLSERGAEYMKKLKLPPKAVMISCLATVGQVGITAKESFTNQQINSIVPDKNKIISEWIYYFFKSNTQYLESFGGGGSVYNNISKSKFEKIDIILPPLPEQRAIAKILSDLDSKIELNQQMNKTLEAIGQAIFKRWFIDFEFPNEKGKPYKSSGGEMVYNEELGRKIPKGWEVRRLKDIVLRLGPGTNFQPERIRTGIPFLNVKNISNGFLDLKDVKYISDKDFERVHKSWKPEEHDVLISRIGTLGNVAIIRKRDLPLSVHYNIIDVKPKNTSHALLYFLFISGFFQNEYHLRKVQTVQEYITIENVEEIKIAIPEKDDLKMFDNFFVGLMNKMEANFMEIQTLSQIRDTLLPKLMSGKIRVPVEVKA